MGFTMAERMKIRAEYAKRYRKAMKPEKTKILNEREFDKTRNSNLLT